MKISRATQMEVGKMIRENGINRQVRHDAAINGDEDLENRYLQRIDLQSQFIEQTISNWLLMADLELEDGL